VNDSESKRHIPLEGAYNMRDAGGYPTQDGGRVRWRTLWRADSLHDLTVADQARLRELGVRTIVDLRHAGELERAPNVFAQALDLTYLHLSILEDDPINGGPATSSPSMEIGYRRYLDERQAQFAAVFLAMAEPDRFPLVVHCTAGKDRTGLVVALLLGLAGVADEQIAEDYALSAGYLEPRLAEIRARYLREGRDPSRLESPAPVMRSTLAHLHARYGGIPSYLRHIGVPEPALAALRETLVEPIPSPPGRGLG
jgi:protein-tyrosine phosphatase